MTSDQPQESRNIDVGAGSYANMMQGVNSVLQGNQFTAAASDPHLGDVLTPKSKRFGISDETVVDMEVDFETNGRGYNI